MTTKEIEITNINRKRKWGWGWSCTPTGEDAYSIETPSRPTVVGTLNQIQKDNDVTYQSLKSGGTFTNSAWFWDGQRITATWTFGLIKSGENKVDIPEPNYENMSMDQSAQAHSEWQEKFWKAARDNDEYGWGWFKGFHLDHMYDEYRQEWSNEPLKIRVEAQN